MTRLTDALAQAGLASLLLLPAGSAAAQTYSYTSDDQTVSLTGGLGAIYLEGNEKVVSGSYTVSHLIWQSTAPVLRGSLSVDAGSGFSLNAEGSVAAWGASYMEDFDWLKGDGRAANWSHRSQHPDTRLDHYFTGAASLAYDLVKDDTASVRLHGGVSYRDVQWTAYGGTYVYSSANGFRDQSGSIAQGQAGATYRQQIPEVFVGFDGEEHYGDIRLGGLLRGGVTLLARTRDDHWLRNLRFVDELRVAPTVALGADVGFALGRNAEITFAARYDHVFEQVGDTKYYDIDTGRASGGASNAASGGLRSAEITAGLRGTF